MPINKHRSYPPKIATKMSDFIRCSVLSNDTIMGVHLGGSHAKGLSNSRSDYDMRIYYLRPLESLISLRPRGLEFNKEFFELMRTEEGNTFMDWGGEKFELMFIPMFSVSAKKALLKSLAKQNGDAVYKLFMGIPLYESDNFSLFLNEMENRFLWDRYKLSGFFHGYLKSQALGSFSSGDRARDYARAVRNASESGSVRPIVKQIIEAVNIGLQGISFLETQVFWGDFWDMFDYYNPNFYDGQVDVFNPDQYDFIERLYNHKTDRELISPTPKFLLEAENMRKEIFLTLSEHIKSMDSSIPDKLTDGQNAKNLDFLNEALMEWYSI